MWGPTNRTASPQNLPFIPDFRGSRLHQGTLGTSGNIGELDESTLSLVLINVVICYKSGQGGLTNQVERFGDGWRLSPDCWCYWELLIIEIKSTKHIPEKLSTFNIKYRIINSIYILSCSEQLLNLNCYPFFTFVSLEFSARPGFSLYLDIFTCLHRFWVLPVILWLFITVSIYIFF